MEKKMNNKGFSLVELIVVIAIMAVLVGVLAPQFIKYVEKSRQSTDISNLDSIKTVVESYYADKDGNDLPDYVKIAASGNTFGVTEKMSGAANYSASGAAAAGGVEDAKVKGKWDTPLCLDWAVSTNTWTYTGESTHYSASAASGNSIKAK